MPPTRVRGEGALLERLFANLLDNALKHGPAGGTIRLTLQTGRNPASRNRFANITGPNATHGALFDFIRQLRKNPRALRGRALLSFAVER